MIDEGFWTVISRAAPSEPGRAHLPFTASLGYLTEFVNGEGFPATAGVVSLALRSAADWNPSFPWRVTELVGDQFAFVPVD